MKNPYPVYFRDELRDAAWLRAVHVGPRTIDVHIGRWRAALKTVGGISYEPYGPSDARFPSGRARYFDSR
ncbi:hypothetical protein [Rhizobium lentis]|uniref:hypothetical protein n=1 Tax=Rhizobium lentis TaxID=1138194 RepID=UPI001FEE4B44|nr:hypothetical protein [Rhizobium lentis]